MLSYALGDRVLADYNERIESEDISLFTILTAMSHEDRRTFLKIQNVVRSISLRYVYLEVGSDLGGSLISPLMDTRCEKAISIDIRCQSQPDERGRLFDFPENSSERMRHELRKSGVPESAFQRLTTFDADVSEVTLVEIGTTSQFAFIDAEHTNRAAFRDFLNVRRLIDSSSVVAFHDANLIFDALLNIEEMLVYQKVEFTATYALDCMFVLAFGSLARPIQHVLSDRRVDREQFMARSRQALNQEIARNTAR